MISELDVGGISDSVSVSLFRVPCNLAQMPRLKSGGTLDGIPLRFTRGASLTNPASFHQAQNG